MCHFIIYYYCLLNSYQLVINYDKSKCKINFVWIVAGAGMNSIFIGNWKNIHVLVLSWITWYFFVKSIVIQIYVHMLTHGVLGTSDR